MDDEEVRAILRFYMQACCVALSVLAAGATAVMVVMAHV